MEWGTMNPFLSSSSGIFATIEEEIAEKIIAAISNKILELPLTSRFNVDEWAKIIAHIPAQVATSQKQFNSNVKRSQLAEICLSESFRQKSIVDLTSGIKSLIEEIPSLYSLTSLSLSFSQQKELLISLAQLTVNENTSDSLVSVECRMSESVVNYSNQGTAKEITKIFANFKPLGNQPYYVSVKPTIT
jgi:hypothetical protein